MNNGDVLNTLKAKVREELENEADKLIDEFAEKIHNELKQRKNFLVSELLNSIEFLVNSNDFSYETTFQINIKAGRSDKE